MAMTGFICHDDYLNKTSKLTDEEIGRLFRACMVYHSTGEVADLDGRESVAFDFIRDDIDRAEKAYAEKCETNRRNRNKGTTADNGRQRSSTVDNDRQPTSTAAGNKRTRTIKEKEKYIDEEDERAREVDDHERAVTDAFREYVGRSPMPEEVEQIACSARMKKQTPDVASEAVRISAGAGAVNIAAYARTILDDWYFMEIRTVDELNSYRVMHDQGDKEGIMAERLKRAEIHKRGESA